MGKNMKKIITSVLIPSLLFYLTGCYSLNEITKEELRESGNEDIQLITKNGVLYSFDKENYFIQSDTLSGDGLHIYGMIKTPFTGSIALQDMDKISAEQIDGSDSFFLTLGVLAWAALIAGLIFLISFGNALDDAHGINN